MNVAQIIPTLASAVAVTAAITDVRDRRIPNRLTYPAMIAGLAVQAALHGWRGLLLGLGGALIFGGLFLIFHLVRAMGAGDVKLAAALGFIIGPAGSWQVMFATAGHTGHGFHRPCAGDVAEHAGRCRLSRGPRTAHTSGSQSG